MDTEVYAHFADEETEAWAVAVTCLVIRLEPWAFIAVPKTALHHQSFNKKAKTTAPQGR